MPDFDLATFCYAFGAVVLSLLALRIAFAAGGVLIVLGLLGLLPDFARARTDPISGMPFAFPLVAGTVVGVLCAGAFVIWRRTYKRAVDQVAELESAIPRRAVVRRTRRATPERSALADTPWSDRAEQSDITTTERREHPGPSL